MKKRFFYPLAVMTAVCFLSGCSEKYSQNGGGMDYEDFKGDQSSIVNMVQYEALSKCFDQFNHWDFGEKINYQIFAGNKQVYNQTQMLLNTKIIDHNITVADEEAVEAGNYKYDLQINVICGGYYFTDGLILKKYSSVTRVMFIQKDTETGKAVYYDSGYRSYRYYTPDFTDIFKVFVYSLLFLAVLLLIYLGLFRKNPKKIIRGKREGRNKSEQKEYKKPTRKTNKTNRKKLKKDDFGKERIV